MPNAVDYPYLRAWCRMMGSHPTYTQEQLEQARRENAPHDATYFSLTMGRWSTLRDISVDDTVRKIHDYAETYL